MGYGIRDAGCPPRRIRPLANGVRTLCFLLPTFYFLLCASAPGQAYPLTPGGLATTDIDTIAELNAIVSDADVAILGANTFTGQQVGPLGSSSAPSFTFAADTDTGIYRPSINVFGISAGGAQAALIVINQMTLGQWGSTSAADYVIAGPNAGAGNSNRAANATILASGQSTGNGAAGDIVLKTSPAGGSGSSLNPYVEAVRVRQLVSGDIILMLGGTTSSFPAIKRNATALNFRLADDSDHAPITAGSVTIGGGAAITKVLSATGTLDFGSTAAGTSTDLTITVTGAALGNVVSLGVPNGSAVANSTFSQWVSATDTVTVRFVNNALVTAADPASGTFRVQVNQF